MDGKSSFGSEQCSIVASAFTVVSFAPVISVIPSIFCHNMVKYGAEKARLVPLRFCAKSAKNAGLHY